MHTSSDDQKHAWAEYAKSILKTAETMQKFLQCIVTGDEMSCFRNDSEIKRQSTQWKLSQSRKGKKVKSKMMRMLLGQQRNCASWVHSGRSNCHWQYLFGNFGTIVGEDCLYQAWVQNRAMVTTERWRICTPTGSCSAISGVKTSMCTQPSPYSPDSSACDYFLFLKLN